ncbi:hypothetical protein [Methylotenera sp.]|uniref:hypothetical protein n=1 Tax=Methylotenera sp. TaxID=2051956 RepID=UPI0025FE5646|nr:hypothetical protein [Methylotenera sp.]
MKSHHQRLLSYHECLLRMDALAIDNAQLFPMVQELMHVAEIEALPPAMIEHYRQAAAATALLVALKQSGDWVDFDVMKLIAGTPSMAFRVAFAKRLAAMHQVSILES